MVGNREERNADTPRPIPAWVQDRLVMSLYEADVICDGKRKYVKKRAKYFMIFIFICVVKRTQASFIRIFTRSLIKLASFVAGRKKYVKKKKNVGMQNVNPFYLASERTTCLVYPYIYKIIINAGVICSGQIKCVK